MNEYDKNGILMEVAPYVSDIEFLRELIDKSRDIEDLKNRLNKLLETEENITKKTDIKIILDKLG
jgi:selenocysteine-specific translation elongation factor